MTAAVPHPVAPRTIDDLARTRWAWVVAHGALTIGVVAAEATIGASIDGAATAEQQQLVDVGSALAVVLLPLGAGLSSALRWSASSPAAWRVRRSVAMAIGVVAATVAVIRIPGLLARLLWHISLDADEPLTTFSLSLQLAVAGVGIGALMAFARSEQRIHVDHQFHPTPPRAAPDDSDRRRT